MIEKRPFGRTGHQSSVTVFGGFWVARAELVKGNVVIAMHEPR